ncbi:hypothetical protein JXB41_06005 [Candidatus Woesearchaeota archaeon]|nr:hypothetical protein [Candidatus Woesearchaeota archaeon]
MRCYKELSRCKICKKRYVVDKDSKIYNSKSSSKYYCKKCYNKHIADIKK